jgi:hypothetical protein
MYGILDAQGLSNISEVVEATGTYQNNTKTVGKLILKSEYKVGNPLEPSPFTKVHQEGTKIVLERTREETMDGAVTDLGIKFKEWLEETEVLFGTAKEVRRVPVKIMGTNVDHYQGMSYEEKIAFVQRNISKVMKDRPQQEVNDIVTGIITGKDENINGIFLNWTKFNKRTKSDQDKGTKNEQLHPERVKTIKVKSKSGGWNKLAKDVLHKHLLDLE